jgi:hypothetical protein
VTHYERLLKRNRKSYTFLIWFKCYEVFARTVLELERSRMAPWCFFSTGTLPWHFFQIPWRESLISDVWGGSVSQFKSAIIQFCILKCRANQNDFLSWIIPVSFDLEQVGGSPEHFGFCDYTPGEEWKLWSSFIQYFFYPAVTYPVQPFKFLLNNIWRSSPYLTGNPLRLRYKAQPVNAV